MRKFFCLLALCAFCLPAVAAKEGLEFEKNGLKIKLVRTKGETRVMTKQGELFLYYHIQERKYILEQADVLAADLLAEIKSQSFFVVRTGKAEYYLAADGPALETYVNNDGEKKTNRISFGEFDLNLLLGLRRDEHQELNYRNVCNIVYNLHGNGVRCNVFVNGNMIYTNTSLPDLVYFNEQLPINRFLKPGTNKVRIGIFDSNNADSELNMSIVDTSHGGRELIPEGPLPLNQKWIEFAFDLPADTILEEEYE
ncbi:MAG: hypothetical protein WCW67_01700 [Candidatus Margulisiibacteriota bacterium]|jgi:hypothetical protein